MVNIETLNVSNAKEFWKQLKKLGPKNSNKIPIEIVAPNGEIITDVPKVLKKWKNDFCDLYMPVDDVHFENGFLQSSITYVTVKEDNFNEPLYINQSELKVRVSLNR